jgi:hypothetical protein
MWFNIKVKYKYLHNKKIDCMVLSTLFEHTLSRDKQIAHANNPNIYMNL